ncbi:hypothetical protein PENTCL1PPCAC_26873, partial [Pristionchus entomophagus]
MACPSGLFYDADHKKCDNKEEIVACGGTATQTPVIKAADVPSVVVENFCDGRTDGFYSNGCQSFFYSCQSGATYKMTCPSGLFYDVAQKRCNNKDEISVCGVPTTPLIRTLKILQTIIVVYSSVPYTTKAADPPVTVTANFCAGKADDTYGAGCQNFFYTCQSGVSYKTTCSSGLFFDVDTKQCNYREVIVACGGKKEIELATTSPVSPALDKPVVAVETFCLAKEDGFYGDGCQTFFYSCQGGATYKMACPTGLFYESTKTGCVRREEAVSCGAVAAAPAAYAAPAAPAAAPAAVVPPVPAPVAQSDKFCSGKADGIYPMGCEGFYYSCTNGYTHKMACPTGLFFDISSKGCDAREKIVACGGVAAAPVAPSSYAAPAAAPAAVVPPVPAPVAQSDKFCSAAPVAQSDKFCSGKADGIYPMGCEGFYYSCTNGYTHKMACPTGLFFDISSKGCDAREKIVACGGVAAAPVAPSSYAAPAAAPASDKFCSGKADGIYPMGCEGFYYSCTNGYTHKMACPTGLFFDISSKGCDAREKIVACGGVAAAPVAPSSYAAPAAAPAPSAYAAPAAAPAAVVPPVPAPVAQSDKFCSGKADGIYPMGCAGFYYSCTNGYTHKMACPTGLFFDISSKGCDVREKIVACGGVAAAPVASSSYAAPAAAPAAVVPPVPASVAQSDKFCSGKADGIYPMGCAGFYYSCTNGYTHKMACPTGLFFDISSKGCDAREKIVACGGVAAAPAAPSAYAAPAAAPVAQSDKFCSGKADGIYPMGCAGFYYSCTNGYTHKMACPTGLFFDISSKGCDVREKIVACGGVAAAPAAHSAYAAPAAAPAAVVPPVPAPVAQSDKFCSGKADGIYPMGCEGFYYSCTNGYTHKMACPTGLFFDISSKGCDVREKIVACGGVAAAPAAPSAYAAPAAAPAAVVPPVPAPVAQSDKFCSGKADGIYPMGCEGFYYSCTNGYTHKMACPTGLFFDISSKGCDVREKIVACGGVAAAPAAPSAYAAPAAAPAAVVPPVPAPVAQSDKFCSGKADGIYPMGCEGFYYSCTNGYTHKMACPTGLFFDISSKGCDVREKIVACGGVAAAPAAPSAYAAPAAAPAAIVPPVPAPVAQSDKFCSGKADGIYPMGCEGFYYSCTNGYTHKMACPTGLFFDISSKGCDAREKIVACGGVAAAPAAPSAYAAPAAAPAAVVPPVPAPVAQSDKFCSGKADGIYPMGCEGFYYSCTNGYTHKMACPTGLFFDISSKGCDAREKIVACGGVAAAPAAPSAYAAPAAAPAAVVPPVPAPVAQSDKFCSGKADGIYPMGCEGFYYSCTNGYTHKMACPTGLFFDISSKGCDVREKIVACGGVAAAPAAPSAYAAPAAAPAAVVPPVPAPVAQSDKFCSGKADGIYPMGCEGFYYSCTNGYTHKMACPTGLFFDISSKGCDVREKIVACGGVAAAPAAPSAYAAPAAAPAAIVPPVPAPVAQSDKFCSGKADGIYPMGCEGFYYSCTNGYTHKMACPTGLFFDISSKGCDVREKIVACGGVAAAPAAPSAYAAPAAAPAAVVPPVPAPVAQSDKFCSGKTDGIYPMGCEGFYYSCTNGYTHKMACPTGLFFDISSKGCDAREKIVACGGVAAAPAAPSAYAAPAAAPAAVVPPVPAPVAQSAAPVAQSDKFCSGKADGIYPMGCEGFYYSCTNGYTHKMACPTGLFFDISSKGCDVREKIVACGGVAAAPAAPAYSQTVPVRDSAPANNFCSGKVEGSYGNMDCATGLFFDLTTKQCDYPEKVVACGGSVQPVPTPAAAPAAPAYSQPAAYAKPVAPAQDKPVLKNVNDRSCTGQKNGFFGEGCNAFFYSCLNGAAYKMACPTGLFYDLELESCQYKDTVPNCGGRRPDVAATPSPVLDSLPPAPISNAQCNGKVDGTYAAADCSQYIIFCQSGLVRKEACQPGLFFNEANGMCDYRENVAKCSARRRVWKSHQSSHQGIFQSILCNINETFQYDAHKEEQQKRVKPALAPSDFPLITIKLLRRTPRQSMFSTSESREHFSDSPHHAPPDPFNSPPPTLPPSSHSPPPHRMGAGKAMALILVAAPICQALAALSTITFSKPLCTLEQIFASRNSRRHSRRRAASTNPRVGATCGDQADGYYSNGCSSDYTACVHGQSMAMHCPSGLKYSASTQMCDYPDNVPECGGSAPVIGKEQPLISPRPVVPITPYNKLPVATQAPVVSPISLSQKDVHPRCAGRSDGIYALAPCSQNYIACVDEKATIGICSDDLHYNSASGMCDWKERNSACTILVRPTPIIPRSVPTPLPTTASPVVRPVGERLNRPTLPMGLNIDCSQVADGVYAVHRCSPFYSRCTDGRLTARGTCPKNLFFSPSGFKCVERSSVSSCSAPLPSPITPIATQAPALAPVQQFCYGKGDGIFGNTCQRSYVICSGGATYSYQCSADFIFNRERVVCDHPSRMPQCGGPTYGY